MKLLRSLGGALSIALILGLLAVAVPTGAQTLNSLTMERTIALSNVATTITPMGIPVNVVAAIASGALEIREQTNYNSQASTLTSSDFVVAAGSPTPTSLGTLPQSSYLAIVVVSIDKIYVTGSAVQFVGSVSQSTTTPYGNYQGSPATFSFGYTKDTPPKINTVLETVAGVIGLYSPAATGTVSITQPPSGGGGGPGTGVTIVVSGPGASSTPNAFESQVNQVNLDASKSTSSNPGALTYSWALAPGFPSASITGGNTATPFIQLSSGRNTYQFILTVTDATGASATANITVKYP